MPFLDTLPSLWQSAGMSTLLDQALRQFDQANRQDPRQQPFEGTTHPRELLFAQRVFEWVTRLNPDASEAVRLAARAHTLRRWEIPRDRYPMDTAGYHAWRQATMAHSAQAAAAILKSLGSPAQTIERVGQLIRWELFPHDPDAQLLEDADCLAFLELKLGDYLAQWDERKLARILRGTWAKMSERARALAGQLPLDQRIRHLLKSD
jgi:hypothetical protein